MQLGKNALGLLVRVLIPKKKVAAPFFLEMQYWKRFIQQPEGGASPIRKAEQKKGPTANLDDIVHS